MSSSASLTCNFTIETSLDVGVSFRSDDGGASYGGQITIFTPGTAGPVTTGLWDDDGNVFFTIYLSENPSLSCTINSGSDPGSWNPYVVVASESGLVCAISGPEQTGPDTYDYTLSISLSSPGGPGGTGGTGETGETKETAGTTAPPAPQHVARMVLPAGGMEAWTQLMQGTAPVPDEINPGSPIVMAWARFDDGTQVAGGVYKSDTPSDFNVKFMWALDANGSQHPGWPIDVSDDEDFLARAYSFSLTPGGETYLLNVVEALPQERFMATNYTFSVSLLDASANPNELQVWQSGTLTLDTSSSPSVTGALTLPGYFKEPIPFSGSAVPPDTLAGRTIAASGQSSEAEITFTIVYNYDGFLYNGSYLGGLMNMLDNNAQEAFLYVIQGLSPHAPSGATFRGIPGSADRRKPRSS